MALCTQLACSQPSTDSQIHLTCFRHTICSQLFLNTQLVLCTQVGSSTPSRGPRLTTLLCCHTARAWPGSVSATECQYQPLSPGIAVRGRVRKKRQQLCTHQLRGECEPPVPTIRVPVSLWALCPHTQPAKSLSMSQIHKLTHSGTYSLRLNTHTHRERDLHTQTQQRRTQNFHKSQPFCPWASVTLKHACTDTQTHVWTTLELVSTLDPLCTHTHTHTHKQTHKQTEQMYRYWNKKSLQRVRASPNVSHSMAMGREVWAYFLLKTCGKSWPVVCLKPFETTKSKKWRQFGPTWTADLAQNMDITFSSPPLRNPLAGFIPTARSMLWESQHLECPQNHNLHAQLCSNVWHWGQHLQHMAPTEKLNAYLGIPGCHCASSLLLKFQSSKLWPLTQNPFQFPLYTSSSPSHHSVGGFELSLELWNFGTPQFYVSSAFSFLSNFFHSVFTLE